LKKAEISLHKRTPTLHTEVVVPESLSMSATLDVYEDGRQGIKQRLCSNEEIDEPLSGTRRADELEKVYTERYSSEARTGDSPSLAQSNELQSVERLIVVEKADMSAQPPVNGSCKERSFDDSAYLF
jgi:hypothetical protein